MPKHVPHEYATMGMSQQTATRKLTHSSPWRVAGSATFNGTAIGSMPPPDRSAGDLGPVSPYIKTTETRVPYLSDTMNRTDFSSIPRKSPIKMGQHKRPPVNNQREYNPAAFTHTLYGTSPGSGAQTWGGMGSTMEFAPTEHRRPNSSSFTHFHTGYLNDSLEVAKPVHMVGRGDLTVNKFGSGFFRRPQTTISNPRAEVIRQHGVEWADHAGRINDDRRETLKVTDSKYRYDLITGQPRLYIVRNGVSEKPIGKRIHGDEGLGPEAPHRGSCGLRESGGRFFMPQLGGPTHHYRLDVMAREGLLVEKKSSILDLSKGELISYGVEDQFAKSDYMKKSAVASQGLADVKVIGLFSPRMQPLNPSGDAETKRGWARGVDLNCTVGLLKKQSSRQFEAYQRDAPGRLPEGTFRFDEGLGTLRPVAFGAH